MKKNKYLASLLIQEWFSAIPKVRGNTKLIQPIKSYTV